MANSPRANYNIHTLRRRSASRRMLCEFGKLNSCIKIIISLIIHRIEPFEHWGMVFFSVECAFKVYHIVEQSVRDFAFWSGVDSFMAGNEISMIRQDKILCKQSRRHRRWPNRGDVRRRPRRSWQQLSSSVPHAETRPHDRVITEPHCIIKFVYCCLDQLKRCSCLDPCNQYKVAISIT